MTRVRCFARRYIREKLFPFVTVFVRASGIAKFMNVLIDTGSPFTVLSTRDIMSTRLSIKTMQSGETVYLAGFRFFNHPIENVSINFKTELGQLLKINLPSIGVLIPTKIDKKMLDEVKDIPSIIGNDFFRRTKICVVL